MRLCAHDLQGRDCVDRSVPEAARSATAAIPSLRSPHDVRHTAGTSQWAPRNEHLTVGTSQRAPHRGEAKASEAGVAGRPSTSATSVLTTSSAPEAIAVYVLIQASTCQWGAP